MAAPSSALRAVAFSLMLWPAASATTTKPDAASLDVSSEADAGRHWLGVVAVGEVFVREEPDAGARLVGLLQQGGVVEVVDCIPDCEAPHGWALLELGAVPRATLHVAPAATDAGDPTYWYGSIRPDGAAVRSRPAVDASVVTEELPPRTVALIPDEDLARRGWLRRRTGGFLRVADVWLGQPSPFRGELSPTLPLGFTFERTTRVPPYGFAGPAERVEAFARVSVRAVSQTEVETSEGTLPRASVRVAFPVSRPPQVPEGARWVHVDVAEQTLVAFQGDTPVFATLVSTGVPGSHSERTLAGSYRVWFKSLHDDMHGEGYSVDEVPWAMFFHGGQALHGVTWHNRFGRPLTHGCVNLSLSDAQWLFEWAPPRLPRGWHTRYVATDSEPTLFVIIDGAAPPRTWP